MCYILLRLICLIFFFLNIKSADDPIKEGRYCVFDEENFNPEFLDEVKNYLKENNQEIFYLFPVVAAYLIDFTKDIKEEMTKENTIYYSKCNFGSELFKLYVNPKKFVENTGNCGYINITKGKLEVKEYGIMYTLKGGKVNRELKCLSNLDKGDVMKNSKNDQPLIFELKFHNGTKKSYFCSNIGIISEYLSRKSKKLSLFKNDNIENFEAVLFLKVKNYFDNMFYDCNKIENITIHNVFNCGDNHVDSDILYIDGDSLFENCVNAKIINLGPSIGNIKKCNFAFKNCKRLEDWLTIGVKFKIGDYALENCEKVKKLKYVNFNGGSTLREDIVISTGCFKNCSSLGLIECLNYSGRENVDISIDGDPRELYYGCKNLKEIVISIDICNDKDYSFKDMFYGVECNNGVKINFRTEDPDFRIPKEKITAMFNGCKIPNDKIKFVIYNTKNTVDTSIHGYEKFLQSKFVSNEDDTLERQGYYKENDEKSIKNISDNRSTLKESDKIKKVKKSIENGSKIGNSCSNCCCFKCCCTEKN